MRYAQNSKSNLGPALAGAVRVILIGIILPFAAEMYLLVVRISSRDTADCDADLPAYGHRSIGRCAGRLPALHRSGPRSGDGLAGATCSGCTTQILARKSPSGTNGSRTPRSGQPAAVALNSMPCASVGQKPSVVAPSTLKVTSLRNSTMAPLIPKAGPFPLGCKPAASAGTSVPSALLATKRRRRRPIIGHSSMPRTTESTSAAGTSNCSSPTPRSNRLHFPSTLVKLHGCASTGGQPASPRPSATLNGPRKKPRNFPANVAFISRRRPILTPRTRAKPAR